MQHWNFKELIHWQNSRNSKVNFRKTLDLRKYSKRKKRRICYNLNGLRCLWYQEYILVHYHERFCKREYTHKSCMKGEELPKVPKMIVTLHYSSSICEEC